MQRTPSALHRAAAWAVVALACALLALGGRRVWRALEPEPRPEVVEAPRPDAHLVDVADPVEDAAPSIEVEPDAGPAWNGSRRPVRLAPPVDGPLEKHPAYVIEGIVRSGTGGYRKRIWLEVVHPGGGSAVTDLHFDRRAANGSEWLAPFKLVKPGQGSYLLRPKITESWPYAIEPPELRVTGSISGVAFLLRDDVPHVDLHVDLRGQGAKKIAGATWWWSLARVDEMRSPLAGLSGAGFEVRGVPVGTCLTWWARAPGHRPANGELIVTEDQGPLEVGLVPGWGVFLWDWPGESESPGEVLLDGRLWGYTSPSGMTLVEADAAPRVIEVLCEGRLALHEKDPQAGDVLGYLPPHGNARSAIQRSD